MGWYSTGVKPKPLKTSTTSHFSRDKGKHKSALSNDSTLSTKDLQKGYGVGMVPAELSRAASNPEQPRRERKWALKKTVGRQRWILHLLQILDFERNHRNVEAQQDESEATLTNEVNEMIGKYQMEGREYLVWLVKKHAFFYVSIQNKIVCRGRGTIFFKLNPHLFIFLTQ